MAEVFKYLSAESIKMEPTLRTAKVLKQEAEDLGYEGKEVLEYVKEHQKLNREERAAWRNIQMAELQAEAEEKKRADDIKIQIANKELTLKEM